jgi:hypothetical protein
LCRTQEIESAGSSAQSRSHASTGSGMQWKTETWNAGAFLDRPLRVRRQAAAGGGITIASRPARLGRIWFYGEG